MAITKMKNGRWRVSVYQPNDAPRIRKVFKTREEAFIGHTLDEVAIKQSHYQTLITQFFTEALDFLNSSTDTTLTMDEVALFAFFRNLSCVPNITMPKTISTFTQSLAEKANIPIYKKK